MNDMLASRRRLIDRITNRGPVPHRSDEWLGGEAHVRFQRGRTWRDLFDISRDGRVGLAFLVGIAVGTSVTLLTRRSS